jgi:hypothetical protein
MAQISLIVRMQCTEDEIKSCKVEKIQELVKKLEPGLELVKKSCEEKFPDLCVEWRSVDPKGVDYEESDEGIWEALYWLGVKTTSSDGTPELDFEVNEFDRWREMGEPLYKDVAEYLREADWSLIKPFCKGDGETLGEIVSVDFAVVKAVHIYNGNGHHFYNNTDWL